jgi:hypothetical protein
MMLVREWSLALGAVFPLFLMKLTMREGMNGTEFLRTFLMQMMW